MNFFEYIAEEVREIMAELGFRTIDEMIGHVECLDVQRAVDHWKAHGLDIAPILQIVDNPYEQAFHCTADQDHGLDEALDQELIRAGRAGDRPTAPRSASTCRSAT